MNELIHIPYGAREFPVSIDAARADVVVARSKNPAATASWEAVVAEAMAEPIGAPSIASRDLRGRKVTVITDDWGRPTPAHRVIPLLLEELARAGAEDANITFITASGMHDPMSRDDLARKLGPDVVARFRCISHDGGDPDMLAFAGVSSMGTPVWVNRYVAEADYRIGLGRVFLHVTHGYEGGYKLILPGVSGFDTIVRDHGFNFAETSVPGVHENPSRAETDNVGRMVGLDYLVNVVVNEAGQPFKAFAGAVEPVHRLAIAYGDREVWGAETGALADIAVVSHGLERAARFRIRSRGAAPGVFGHQTGRRRDRPLGPPGSADRRLARGRGGRRRRAGPVAAGRIHRPAAGAVVRRSDAPA